MSRITLTLFLPLAALAACSSLSTLQPEPKHNPNHSSYAEWTYSGAKGPASWGTLSKDYKACGVGTQQSPINLVGAIDANINSLNVNWRAVPLNVKNNGHSIQIDTPMGNNFSLGTGKYALLQFHMHHPSEHSLNGQRFPMELHFVHQKNDGTLGVIGVFIEKGAFNPVLDSIFSNMPTSAGTINKVSGASVDIEKLLPKDRQFYEYQGSLTTPPCSEIVSWAILSKPIQASPEQIAKFAALYPMNARPIQATNRRVILEHK